MGGIRVIPGYHPIECCIITSVAIGEKVSNNTDYDCRRIGYRTKLLGNIPGGKNEYGKI